jgi:hypothetical protein
MIYLARDENYIKIGYAHDTNLHRRWIEIQIGNPRELEFRIFDKNATMADEQLLQKSFKNQHYRGEWFLINEELEKLWNNSSPEYHNKVLGRPSKVLPKVIKWLENIMEDGPILASEIHQKALKKGFSRKSLTRAARVINIERKQTGLSNTIVWHKEGA